MNGQPGTAQPGEGTGAESLSAEVAAAAKLLSGASDVTLLAHVNPDADALGSALALGRALRGRGARVRVSFGHPGAVPRSLRVLDTDGLIVPADEVPAAPPLLVVCDAGSLQRLGALAGRVRATIDAGGSVLNIDHHVANPRFGTHHVIDETAVATVLLVLRLLDELGAPLDLPIARCLYAGLVTDSGRFRRAQASTHLVAARLLEAGVEPDELTRSLMDTHPFAWLPMLSGVLGQAALEPAAAQGLGMVHAVVRLAESEPVRSEELDSVIDIVRTTAEAEVAVVLKEIAADRWSVSLRADRRVDVGKAANLCGGGGHRLAAGFTADGSAEDVLDSVRAALEQAPLLD